MRLFHGGDGFGDPGGGDLAAFGAGGLLAVDDGENGLHEGGEVVGAASGDDGAVDDAFFVDPLAAGVGDVVGDGEEAGAAPATEGIGGAEHPRAVTDGGHGDVEGGGFADEADHAAVAAHEVGAHAAGDDDEVVIAGGGFPGFLVGFLGVAPLSDVGDVGARADHVDGVAGFFEAEAGILEFEVFVFVFDEDCDFGHSGLIVASTTTPVNHS